MIVNCTTRSHIETDKSKCDFKSHTYQKLQLNVKIVALTCPAFISDNKAHEVCTKFDLLPSRLVYAYRSHKHTYYSYIN